MQSQKDYMKNILISLLLVLFFSAHAQNKSGESDEKFNVVATQNLETQQEKRQNISKNFRGDSLAGLIGKFELLTESSRDEFTRRDDRNAATTALRNKTYKFIISSDANWMHDKNYNMITGARYDADAEILKINLWTKNEDFALNRKSNSSYLFDSKYSTIVVSRTSNRDSYMGQNAYGAKTKISSTQMNEYGLAIANGKQAPDTEIFSYSIPVKLREARALKDDISFYAEVNLIDVNQTSSGELTGDVLKSVFVRKATISEPSESFMTGKYLLAYIKEIGVYKKSTGEVLGWKKFE